MRDLSAWLGPLPKQLASEGFSDEVMPVSEFCRVELGLTFLLRYFPGEPIGALQPILSEYVRGEDDLTPVIRRLRHRMGDVARRGYWRRLVNLYMRVPEAMRAYDRTDDPLRRVNDRTVFVARPTSVCPERHDHYGAALTDRLTYRSTDLSPTAQASRRYSFLTRTGIEHVALPDWLPPSPPLPRMSPARARQREPWHISFTDDLAPVAEWIDEQLKDRPDVTNRNWRQRLNDLQFSRVDADLGTLNHQAKEFTIDGIEHIVGLMNSGKTTLADLITIEGAKHRKKRICLVVSSVSDVYAKVSFLRSLGIDAVPLIGRSSRGEHAGRYWRTIVEEAQTLFPDENHPPDPAAAYANTTCLLEPYRQTSHPRWTPLDPTDFPCQNSLRETNDPSRRAHDCPLLSICPAQKAVREVTHAQVWVTTPQCLVTSKAEPSTMSMRWFEQVQHDMDLMIIDEADSVQQVLDTRFVQTEQLVAKDNGWTHRMVARTNDALASSSMAPVINAEVHHWHEYLQIHQQSVFSLSRLALASEGEALRELLGDATFTAHSLLRQVARMLHGLPRLGEGERDVEDQAEDFYQQHLQSVAEQPLEMLGHDLEAVVTQLIRSQRDDTAVRTALDAWIDEHASATTVASGQLERHRALLRLVVEAAIWAGRITTTFFEMGTLYPSVRDHLQLPDEERFFLNQPPRDYRPLIPEAPMGNILALRWAAGRGGGASLQLLWVHGIGRWLLHHAHDLLACEDVEGPHVILTSATSWIPGSSFYHIPITPSAVLGQRPADRKALMKSTLSVRPARIGGVGDPIFVSGRSGAARFDALRQMVTALCEPVGGRHRSLIDELRAQLPAERQQVLFVVLSGAEAKAVGETVNNRTRFRARHVVPDASDPGTDGIRRRLVGGFGKGTDDILVAAEMSIQRGYNILNASDTAALGAVVYLTRSHPPPFDLAFPLSMVSQLAMRHLQEPALAQPGTVGEAAQNLRNSARSMWFDVIGRPLQFRNIHPRYRTAFVANNLVPMSQTIGRSIRGNQPTRVLLCDAAFAERLASGDAVPDTARTSLVVATDVLLSSLLTAPADDADTAQRCIHEINTAVWGLLGHLVHTNDPLGTQRR